MRVNNRKVLNGVMEVAGLAGDDKEASAGSCCAQLTSWIVWVPTACVICWAKGRKDASGDFTKGAGLDAEQAEVVMGFMKPSATQAPPQSRVCANW